MSINQKNYTPVELCIKLKEIGLTQVSDMHWLKHSNGYSLGVNDGSINDFLSDEDVSAYNLTELCAFYGMAFVEIAPNDFNACERFAKEIIKDIDGGKIAKFYNERYDFYI